MLIAYIWLYTLFLVIIWWFCIVAKIHAYKFKNFSNHIEGVTFLLIMILLILSISGYVALFSLGATNSTFTVDKSVENFDSFDNIEY